jgi:hypothetical protein
MKKHILLLTAAAGLLLVSGCIHPRAHLNETALPAPAVSVSTANAAIVEDASRLIAKMYPQAGTQFTITVTDDFGKSLADALRAKGFGVEEVTKKASTTAVGTTLSYVFGPLSKEDNLTRLTLRVGQTSFSRVYNSFDLTPAGQWSRRS